MISLASFTMSTGCQLTSEKLVPGHRWWCLDVKMETLWDGLSLDYGIDKDEMAAVVEMVTWALKHFMGFGQIQMTRYGGGVASCDWTRKISGLG